jgi:hypothetical protein
MGWWNTSVLGGDQPLDTICELEDILGVDELYPLEDIDDLKRKRVQRNWDWEKVSDWLFGEKEEDGNYIVNFIDAQVTACVGIACGVEFTDYHKEFFSEMIDEDPWAKEDEERKQSMNELKEALLAYEDGVPTFVENKGCIESLIEKIETSKG